MSVARGGTGAILRARHRQEIRVSIAPSSIQISPYFFGHLYSVIIFFTHFFQFLWIFLVSMHAHFATNPKSSPLVLEKHFTTRCCSLSPSEQIHQAAYRCAAGKEPFKCYVTPMGVWGVKFSGKKRYEGVRFNVISVTRGWMGVQFSGKKALRNT